MASGSIFAMHGFIVRYMGYTDGLVVRYMRYMDGFIARYMRCTDGYIVSKDTDGYQLPTSGCSICMEQSSTLYRQKINLLDIDIGVKKHRTVHKASQYNGKWKYDTFRDLLYSTVKQISVS